ncbi:efflux transporter outer membrane subunit [Shewanella algae]|uniref:efflux transporter outer membrane subunit n=1 Tax=Shewanella algae TaxID=38313 RepID=UPI003AAE833B
MMLYKVPSLIALSVALAGCSLAPDYQKPQAPVASAWQSADTAGTEQAEVHGWEAFVTDAALRELVQTALTNNRSFRQTLLDIESARAQYRIVQSDRLPQLQATGSGNRQQTPASLSPTGVAGVSSNYQVGLSLPEYELDLFARVKNLSDAALEQYLATEAGSRATQIALIAEVIQAFLTYESTQQQAVLANSTSETRAKSLELVTQRRSLGDASALDYQEAYSLLQQANIALEQANRAHQQAQNALVLLLGTSNTTTLLQSTLLAQPNEKRIVQRIAAGTPSLLIAHRPDILASEHRLKARHADIGAARAAFFPRISLTGNFGTASNEMSGLFESGSKAWAFMPQISLPIFTGGRNRANLTLAEVRKDIAIAEYEYQIQSAFREVADALVASSSLQREENAQAELASSANKTLQLAEARYRAGVDSNLRYLDAQRQHFSAQQNLITVSTQHQLALVDLFRALGGNWYTKTH